MYKEKGKCNVMNKLRACLYVDQNNLFFRYKKLDFKKLYQKLSDEYDIVRAVSYMAIDSNSDSQKKFITYLSNNGFKCVTIDINDNTNVDHILIADMSNDFRTLHPEVIILASGDAHFAYNLGLLSSHGARIVVIGAKDFVAYELLKVCDSIKYIEDFKDIIID